MLSQRRTRLVEALRTRKGRQKHGLVLVEGVRACAEALESGASVRFAAAAPRLRDTPDGSALLTCFLAAGIDVGEASERAFADMADTKTPQGVLLVCGEPGGVGDLVQQGGRYLVLDTVQDPGNAGTLVRASVAFGINGIVALDGTVDLWGAKAVRSAVGMSFRVPITRMSAGDLMDRCLQVGLPLVLAEAGGQDVAEWERTSGWALVVGNEGRGSRPALREAAHARVEVPMPGSAESLNAGVAGSILLYSMTRRVRT